jgi:hypothetical protein
MLTVSAVKSIGIARQGGEQDRAGHSKAQAHA